MASLTGDEAYAILSAREELARLHGHISLAEFMRSALNANVYRPDDPGPVFRLLSILDGASERRARENNR